MALVEGQVSEFSQDVDITDFPVEAGDEKAAEVMTDLKQFISYKNRIQVERQKFLRSFFLHGTGIWHIYWDPAWKGGKGPNKWIGDVRWKALHPRHFFPDARCKEDIHDGRRVHKAMYVTLEYIRERYPEFGSLAQSDVLDTTLLTEDEELSEQAKQDQSLLVETWYIGKPLIKDQGDSDEIGLHVIWWCGETSPVYLNHANFVYCDPGETPKFPFVVRQRYPRENSVWGYGEAHFLKQPQIMLNKTAEIIMEANLHESFGQTVYEQDAMDEDQEKVIRERGTLPGMWFAVNRKDGILRLFGKGASANLMSEVGRLQRAMENIVGRFDVSQGRAPGSITAFRALDLLAQRAQVRLRSADVAITTAYEDSGNLINNLIYRNYTETRAYRILGTDEQTNKTAVKKRDFFRLKDVQKVYHVDSGKVVPYNDFQPSEGMVEGEHYEVYCPELDVVCKTSTAMPSDRVFYMEMAKELYSQQLIDPETFFYVLQNGKFPPLEELIQKLQERQQQAVASKAPQGQSQAPAPIDQPQPLDPAAILATLSPEEQQRFAALPPEQQQALLEATMSEVGAGGPVGEVMR
jgi:hypothetical protein